MTSTPNRFPAFAWGVVFFNLVVIAWGVVVRVTGSGAGCGSHWPLCNGQVIPLAGSTATAIELTHRATSGLALAAVVVLLVWAFRAYERRHPVRTGAVGAMTFILAEAGLGAGLVLFELVGDNASMTRAAVMALHLANTFMLLAFLALTAYWAGGGERVRLRHQGSLPWVVGLGLVGTLLIGTSGAVAALGDTLFPASTLREALRQDLSATSHILIQLRIFHPMIAVLVGMFLVLVARTLRNSGLPAAQRWGNALFTLVFVQLAAGGINLILMAPIWMQVLHLLLADLLWICLVLAGAASLAESRQEAAAKTALAEA